MKIAFIVKQLTLTEPFGIMSLFAILKRAGQEVKLLVAKQDDVVEELENFKPRIVGYSIMTGIHRYYLDYNRFLRKKLKDLNFLSIFGGPHCTFMPEVINQEGVDAICRGEGDEALLDFINRLERDEHYFTDNWWVKKDGQIIKNKQRPLVEDLDSLPPLDREIVYQKSGFLKKKKVKNFIASRGCPFDCSYCFNHAYKELYRGLGKIVRRRSVDNLLAEIKVVKEKHPFEMIWFNEDLFVLDKIWLREFVQKYKKDIKVPFCCTVRLNLLDEETVSLMKEAGCVSVFTAIETANDYLRNQVLNRNMSKEQMERGLNLLRAQDIKIEASNMIGLPGETLDDMLGTLSFNTENRIDYSGCCITQPYPGTELYRYCLENDCLVKETDEIPTTYHGRTIIKQSIPLYQLDNLHHLFAICVNWPFFSKFIKILIKLPLTPFYKIAYKLNYGYQVKTKIFPYKLETNISSIYQSVKNFLNKNE